MGEIKKIKRTSENVESRTLVRTAFDVARSLDVATIVVQADELRDIRCVAQLRDTERDTNQIIWLTRRDKLPLDNDSGDVVLSLPDTTLTRMSQLKMGLLLAVMNEHIDLDETVICLSGVVGSERLDTLLIANARRDFPWFRKRNVDDLRTQLPHVKWRD